MIGVGLTSLGLGKLVGKPVPLKEAKEANPLYTADWLKDAAAGNISSFPLFGVAALQANTTSSGNMAIGAGALNFVSDDDWRDVEPDDQWNDHEDCDCGICA